MRDYVSRDILQGILDDTEEHIDWLETHGRCADGATRVLCEARVGDAAERAANGPLRIAIQAA